jgi:hypothetical protein
LIKRLVDEVQNKTSPQNNNNNNNSRSYEDIDREHLLRNMDDMQKNVIDLENKSALIATENERLHFQLKEKD